MIILGNDIFPMHSSTTLSPSRRGCELAHVVSVGAQSHLSNHPMLILSY